MKTFIGALWILLLAGGQAAILDVPEKGHRGGCCREPREHCCEGKQGPPGPRGLRGERGNQGQVGPNANTAGVFFSAFHTGPVVSILDDTEIPFSDVASNSGNFTVSPDGLINFQVAGKFLITYTVDVATLPLEGATFALFYGGLEVPQTRTISVAGVMQVYGQSIVDITATGLATFLELRNISGHEVGLKAPVPLPSANASIVITRIAAPDSYYVN